MTARIAAVLPAGTPALAGARGYRFPFQGSKSQEFCISKLLTLCAAIALLLSAAGIEKVYAKGGTVSLHGPWPSTSAQNNATNARATAGYEAKSFFMPRLASAKPSSLDDGDGLASSAGENIHSHPTRGRSCFK
jgi:hypothetical protein